jgi:hypothetical protein
MDINYNFQPHSDSIGFNAGFGNEHVHGSGTINLPSGDIHNISSGVTTPIGDFNVSRDFWHDSTGVKFCGNDGFSAGLNIPDDSHTPPSFGASFHADF